MPETPAVTHQPKGKYMGLEFPPGFPDEYREYLTDQVNRTQMQTDVQRHDMLRFFMELTEDQSKQLLALIRMMGDPEVAAHYCGFMLAVMQSRFNLCAGCGKNHDAEAAAIAAGGAKPEPPTEYVELQIIPPTHE